MAPACAPTQSNNWDCEVPTASWPPHDVSNPEIYLNSAYWPAEERPDIEMYAIQRYGYNYKNCIADLPHYCFLVDARAVGYPVTHKPAVGDLWLAPGECLIWGDQTGVSEPTSCSDRDTDWYVGYVEQVFPDGSFLQSWGGSDTPADSGLALTLFSGAMDPDTDFIGLRPRGTPLPGTSRTPSGKSPQLTSTLGHVGRRVSVSVHTTSGAEGSLTFSAQSGAATLTRAIHLGRSYFTASRAGVWRVRVLFSGRDGWRSQAVTRSLRIE
jgi:hypothetical protein